jgi:hypothetical protein
MVRVVLRNRKVLVYNDGDRVAHDDKCFSVLQGENGKFLIAKIPVDIVERVEFSKPCQVLKAKPIPKRATY